MFAWLALLVMISMTVSEVRQRGPQRTIELSDPQFTELVTT